ncbi:adenylate cyclase type 10-like [Columba livia]|uniref:adenylate cyclase type 10-like n=1 Tax=Columba livia TaxID=8932 RepID=UPI0031B9FFB3
MSLLSVGDGSRHYFCICGQAMHDIHEAQELVKEGEVILSATSWELCEQHQLMTKHLGDNGFVKVAGMEQMSWSECQDTLCKLAGRPTNHCLEGQVLNTSGSTGADQGKQLLLLTSPQPAAESNHGH